MNPTIPIGILITSSRVTVKLPSVVAFNSSFACTVMYSLRHAFVIKGGGGLEGAVGFESEERIIVFPFTK